MKHWLAQKMRTWADHLDPHGAPRMLGWTFTFERGKGIVFHEDGRVYPRPRGCRLAYLGNDEYEHAHTDAENPL